MKLHEYTAGGDLQLDERGDLEPVMADFAALAKPKPRRMQAKDITDDVLMTAVRKVRGVNGVPEWSCLWDIQAALPQFPPKVVLAKLRSAVKRKLLDGCCCGCRGDFEEPAPP